MGCRILSLLLLALLAACDSAEPSFATPIQHVVVIVKENHTFESYFAGFPGADAPLTAHLSDGGVIHLVEAPSGRLPGDLPHDHATALRAYRDGGMDGFDGTTGRTLPGGVPLPFAHYPEARIPNYWAYARSYVLADHFFSTTLAPSFPGYLAIWTAQSPAYGNPFPRTCLLPDCAPVEMAGCDSPKGTWVQTYDAEGHTVHRPPCFDIPSLVDSFDAGRLGAAHLTWLDYAPRTRQGFDAPLRAVQRWGQTGIPLLAHVRDLRGLLFDLDHGDLHDHLPNLLVVDANDGPYSEHPPEDPCPGEGFTVQLMNRLMRSPDWPHTAVLITWDDWGGFYDSVAPPVERLRNGAFFSPGFRVPAIIVSPYAKRGDVLHRQAEQASIPALVELLFHLPRMADRDPNARDARAGSLLDAFDFAQPPRPPLFLRPRACR